MFREQITDWNTRRLHRSRMRRLKRMQKAGTKIIENDWFAGKSVAIIGPSKSVKSELAEHSAEDFNIIVRMNKGLELALHDSNLWGPRTDVLFHNLKEEDAERGSGRLDDEFLTRAGLRYLIFPHASPEKWRKNLEITAQRFPSDAQVTLCIPPLALYAETRKELGGLMPTTGYMAISTFMSLPLDRLGIFGISFFSTGYTPGYTTSQQATTSPLEWARMSGFHNPEREAALTSEKLSQHLERAQSFPILLGASMRQRMVEEGLDFSTADSE